jgi:hypothetical protein
MLTGEPFLLNKEGLKTIILNEDNIIRCTYIFM